MRKKANQSDDDEDGFIMEGVTVEVKYARISYDPIVPKLSEFLSEANPILRSPIQQVVQEMTQIDLRKDNVYIKEAYSLQPLIYERLLIPERNVAINEKFILKHQFSNSKPVVCYKSQHYQPFVPGIRFFSDFDSGNLFRVYRVSDSEFDLVMQSDMNCVQVTAEWFYFGIECGSGTASSLKLNLVNITRNCSSFTMKCQPLIKSQRLEEEKGTDWFRYGSDVDYRENTIIRSIDRDQSYDYLSTLSFTIKMLNSNYPYSFTQLSMFLDLLKHERQQISVQSLCLTFLGKECPVIYIQEASRRTTLVTPKTIVVMARLHPAETLSSFILEYMVKSLLTTEPEFEWLLQHFNWVFVPMMNVDGVVVGNAKTDANGYDLNKVWQHPVVEMHPTVHYVKELCRQLKREGNLQMFLDLQCHPKSYNSFCYGYQTDFLQSRIFPVLLDSISDIFDMTQCTFSIDKNRRNGTARQTLINEIGCSLTYTIQTSYIGYNKNLANLKLFTLKDLQTLAQDILKGVFLLFEGNTYVISKFPEQKRYKLTKPQAISLIESNEKFYSEICQNLVDDHSHSGSSEEVVNDLLKKSKKKVKKHWSRQQVSSSFNKTQQSMSPVMTRQKSLQMSNTMQIRKKMSQPKKNNSLTLKKDGSPKEYQQSIKQVGSSKHKSPRTLLLLESSASPMKKSNNLLPQSMLKFLDGQLQKQRLMMPKAIEIKKIHRQIEYPLNTVSRTFQTQPNEQIEYRERQRIRSQYFMEKIHKKPIDQVKLDSSVSILRPSDPGNVRFSPFQQVHRVHSQMHVKDSKEVIKYQKIYKLYRMIEGKDEFQDWELDPQSHKY